MKRIIICLVFVLVAAMLVSKSVEQERAIAIAVGFMAEYGDAEYAFDSVLDFKSHELEPVDFYIIRFNPQGFVLIAGDTRSMPILGYSITGSFPKAEIPAHTKWYFDQYSLSFAEIRKHPQWFEDPRWSALEKNDYSEWRFTRDVAPLLSTTWDQGWPYNSMCPDDTNGPGGHVYAGCVATAMAQIMKKWNYPIMGNGSHSYYADGYGTQSVNFGATSYNWSSMPNSISQENIDISTLLYHCGVAVDMMYSPSGSGAYSDDARYAMVNYFRYNNAAQHHWAHDYSSTIWASMLRSDLDLGRPIFYRGQSSDGGHAFVLDGYQGTDYFHFNWGWSGHYDGFFYLNNLNPGSSIFTEYQGAILDMYPLNNSVNDLALVSLTGPAFATLNQPNTFTATVANLGTAVQSSYSVRLMCDSGVLLAETPGTYLASGATQTFAFNWTPTQTGPITIYAKVFLNGDEVEQNNESNHLNVVVLPDDVQAVTIGDGSQTARYPMDFYWKNSLYQCLYMQNELGFVSGTITDLQLYNNFSSNIPNGATKIWLGTTSLQNLSGGYIPANQLTLVFDGNVQYPEGENEILIPFSTPYHHSQGNLVMMVQRPMDSTYYSSSDFFKCQTIGSSRARYAYSDNDSFNPMSPPSGTLTGQFPKVSFFYTDATQQELLPPVDLTATLSGSDVHLSWLAPGTVPPPPVSFEDGFEDYADFSLNFAPWLTVDVDQSATYGMVDISWPNAYAAQAYIIFNPSATTPAVTDLNAHSGNKMAACFAATASANNDWLISPRFEPQSGQFFNFWARSYTPQYGLERFKVGVSSGGTDPADFNIISAGSYMSAPADWTLYSYDLSPYIGQVVSVGIQCVSDDAFIFLVDDVSVGTPPSNIYQGPYAGAFMGNLTRATGIPVPGIASERSRDLLGYKIYRNGSPINIINNDGTLDYDDINLPVGTYNYTVTAIYTSGESEPAGPVTVTIAPVLDPPINLTAEVMGTNTVELNWTAPGDVPPPPEGQWITWCNDVLGTSVGTGDVVTFDVAHRFTQADLASVAGGTISQVKFVPSFDNCIYTVKVWTGGSASNAGTLVSVQAASNLTIGTWNTVILNTPVSIPNTGDVYIGYESNTQGGHPAGCDAGPPIEGKGNMMYIGGSWNTLTGIAPSLTFNWLIETYVGSGDNLRKIELAPIVEAPRPNYPKASLSVVHNEVTPQHTQMRNHIGFKVYRDGYLINTVTNPATTSYSDGGLTPGTYSYTVTAVYAAGESTPAGPATAIIHDNTPAPVNLTADVTGRDVALNWESPEAPQQGEWITWCNDVLGNSIGTGGAATFAVAHRYTQTDLASITGGTITQLKFVPAYPECVYTAKVWTGGTASNAGTLVSSQVVPTFAINQWNTVVLNTPVPIPTTGDVYIGYEVNTQGGHPAGCDTGPPIEGKGNMMYINGVWDTLSNIASNLTYNWLIQTFVSTGAGMKDIQLTPIVEAPQITMDKAVFDVMHKDIPASNRALVGFKVYRDNVLIATLSDPLATTYTDVEVPNGIYIYGVSALHTMGESPQATIQVTVDLQLAEIVFEDSFESYPDFVTEFAPWTLLDVDHSNTYSITDIDFPNSGSPMAYIIFNPSATVPPMTGIYPHSGSKMAASFAAINGPNFDLMVTPQIQLGTGSALKFYARSHTNTYGLERFRVGVSLLPDIIQQGFQWINGAYSEAPANWTEYIFDLTEYDNQAVYITIRCISNDAFIFYVDDFSVHSDGGYVVPPIEMGSISGTVTSDGAPLSGATIQVAGTQYHATSTTNGTYSIPSVPAGMHTVSATKHGYSMTSHSVNIVANQNTIQDFALTMLPQVTVTGRIVGNDQPNTGIPGATISLSGFEPYSATTNAQGQFTIPNVFANRTYQYIVNAAGYQPATGQAIVGSTNLNMGDIILSETLSPPHGVAAVESDDFTQVSISWQAPNPSAVDRQISRPMADKAGRETFGLVEASTQNDERVMIGYEVYRLLAADETNDNNWILLTSSIITHTYYVDTAWHALPSGIYKYAVKAIYTGGASSPVAFSNSVSRVTSIGSISGSVHDQHNTPISGATVVCGTSTAMTNANGVYSMEVIAGIYNVICTKPGYHPSFQSDVVIVENQTTTQNFILAEITLPPHSVQAVDLDDHVSLTWQAPEMPDNEDLTLGTLHKGAMDRSSPAFVIQESDDASRALNGYRIWRLQQGQEDDEASWISLTSTAITATAFQDTQWNTLEDGTYKWAVNAVYTGGATSSVAFSNPVSKVALMGTIAGSVLNQQNAPISGATIICGTYTATTNTLGAYSIEVIVGTHNVTASHPNYITATQSDIIVETNQTTTVNFFLSPSTDADDHNIPAISTALNANFPNPFNPETTITYSLREASPVNIEIYNIKGQLVKTLVNDHKAAGSHTVIWNGTDNSNRSVSSGVYYYKMNAGKYSSTRKMILMK